MEKMDRWTVLRCYESSIMVSVRKTLRLIYFIMKHKRSMLYLKEIINLPNLLEFESIN